MRKAAPQAPEVPACGAAFAVCCVLCAVRRAAGQHGRNKPFYQDYSFRKEHMSVGNLVHKHSYLDAEA